jgi:hypothetical protein
LRINMSNERRDLKKEAKRKTENGKRKKERIGK